MPTNKEKALLGSSGGSLAAVAYLAYELLVGTQNEMVALSGRSDAIEAEMAILKTQHAQRCEVDSKYFEGQASLMSELAGIEKNTASRYVALAEANGGLSEVDRLRMEEKLRRQAEYEGRGQAFSQAAQTVCLQP